MPGRLRADIAHPSFRQRGEDGGFHGNGRLWVRLYPTSHSAPQGSSALPAAALPAVALPAAALAPPSRATETDALF